MIQMGWRAMDTDAFANMQTRVPEHLRAGLWTWCAWGVLPGHFLQAVLKNDLRDAFARGDKISVAGLQPMLEWLWNWAPGQSHGSLQRVASWEEHQAEFRAARVAYEMDRRQQSFSQFAVDLNRARLHEEGDYATRHWEASQRYGVPAWVRP